MRGDLSLTFLPRLAFSTLAETIAVVPTLDLGTKSKSDGLIPMRQIANTKVRFVVPSK